MSHFSLTVTLLESEGFRDLRRSYYSQKIKCMPTLLNPCGFILSYPTLNEFASGNSSMYFRMHTKTGDLSLIISMDNAMHESYQHAQYTNVLALHSRCQPISNELINYYAYKSRKY